MQLFKRKLGYGTISLALCILGILFSCSFKDRVAFGDVFLSWFGLKAWSVGSSGTHYTVLYSLIFFAPGWYFGAKYKEDFGSKIGRIVSAILTVFIVILTMAVTSI